MERAIWTVTVLVDVDDSLIPFSCYLQHVAEPQSFPLQGTHSEPLDKNINICKQFLQSFYVFRLSDVEVNCPLSRIQCELECLEPKKC